MSPAAEREDERWIEEELRRAERVLRRSDWRRLPRGPRRGLPRRPTVDQPQQRGWLAEAVAAVHDLLVPSGMARRARDRDGGGTRAGGTGAGGNDGGGTHAGGTHAGGTHAGGGTVSLAEAAEILGVGEDLLLEAPGDHGMARQEARGARLLVSELESFRTQLRTGDDRARAELSALRDVLDDG